MNTLIKSLSGNLPIYIRDIDTLCIHGNLDRILDFSKAFLYQKRDRLFNNACKYGHLHIVEYLFRNFDVNVFCGLHQACVYGYLNIVMAIVKKVKGTEDDISALYELGTRNACAHGQLHIVKYFIEECFCHSLKTYLQCTLSGNLETFKYILEKINEARIEINYNQVLYSAFYSGSIDIIRFLVINEYVANLDASFYKDIIILVVSGKMEYNLNYLIDKMFVYFGNMFIIPSLHRAGLLDINLVLRKACELGDYSIINYICEKCDGLSTEGCEELLDTFNPDYGKIRVCLNRIIHNA